LRSIILPYNRAMRTQRNIPPELCWRIESTWRRLEAEYGVPELQSNGDPMVELISTILSQHTTDTSSWNAFLELRRRFPTWEAVLAAPVEEVIEAIRGAGLANQKAQTIRHSIAALDHESLTALAAMPVSEAREQLTEIRGVGEKTASCVLLFALGMPAQPVDTHIERVSKRLGIANGESNATGIQRVLEHCLPADGQSMYAFHKNMIRHGREICLARTPRCEICVLADSCEYYARIRGAAVSQAPAGTDRSES